MLLWVLSGCALLPGERSHTPTGHVVIASGGTQGVYHMYARPLARELHSRAPDLDVDIVEQLAREVPLRLVPLGEPALAMQDRFGAVYDQAAIPEGAYGLRPPLGRRRPAPGHRAEALPAGGKVRPPLTTFSVAADAVAMLGRLPLTNATDYPLRLWVQPLMFAGMRGPDVRYDFGMAAGASRRITSERNLEFEIEVGDRSLVVLEHGVDTSPWSIALPVWYRMWRDRLGRTPFPRDPDRWRPRLLESALTSSVRKWRRLPKITSRGTSVDHGSPSTSMAALIAHPDPGGR